MSLFEAFGRVSREHDDQFLEMMANRPEPEPDPDEETAEVAPAVPAASDPVTAREGAPDREAEPAPAPNAADPAPTGPGPSDAVSAAPDETVVKEGAPVPAPVEGPEAGAAVTARPEGIAAAAEGLLQTEAERAAEIADIRIRGSVVDGGSAQDMLDGKHPRPSVMSQREIDRMNRLRSLGLELEQPYPWPDFMPYPTEAELRELLNPDTTPEMIRAFEINKQKEADDMAARAAEINDWIFRSGTMRLNEEAQMRRAARRDAAITERNRGRRPEDRLQNETTVEDVSDLDLYGDHFYGVRFAMLLRLDSANVSRLATAPVAAWGHDRLITLDGGRIRARDGELVVTSVSAQAAQMLVMEAKARGWETLRVSGDNEFCAAVKLAAKQAGMGAIIHRRGPLGIGPFSRPEVIMPLPPRSRVPVGVDQGAKPDQARKEAEAIAPPEDVEAANALGQLQRQNRERQTDRKRLTVSDPLVRREPAPEAPSPN
ncbi:hypothetical protein IQ03_01236 [Gemmobacter caeni]|uniref:Large polyvalent protein-associated domain-containing protein n=1 Tax=Gemmobacter caeni TaxID=589035 RepID=A0A2T6B8V3_9RHOB|nr:LPD7 domain-containing protein [Gemmobacter caeni]PTX52511.1 hypothetical protein C8N34_102291 [Gemmobacter caeni]TWJ02818.1 hypothetical protein IQ03_01236 [Gemmobacter caeni]